MKFAGGAGRHIPSPPMLPPQVSQHEACLLRVTVDAAAGEKVTPTTILTGVMVDAAGIADRLETGNVGQWDMMSKPYN